MTMSSEFETDKSAPRVEVTLTLNEKKHYGLCQVSSISYKRLALSKLTSSLLGLHLFNMSKTGTIL